MESTQNAGSMVLLTRLAKVVYRRSSEELLGMRLRHFVTLSYVRDRGCVPQQQMCEMLTIDANNLVLLLNELEDAGHIRRRRDADDRRRHIVELTPSGRAALERAERAQESIEKDVLAGLSPAERATLHDLLRRALAACSQPPVPDPPVAVAAASG
jgi:DNA-binding MarR family transcriptional regulator